MAYNQQLAQRVQPIIHQMALIDEKKMFGGIVYFLNGHMCCAVWDDWFVVRVGQAMMDKSLACEGVNQADLTGRMMK
ncbi:MAG: TfoX/Sxy family protein [Pseudomonadota bacterium]